MTESHPPAPRAGGGLLVGRPFGIPVYVAPTWFLVAAVITYVFAPRLGGEAGVAAPVSYLLSFAFAVLLYLSVLVHELSHSLVARGLGMRVRQITLHLLGGVSEIEEEAATPGREFLIAFAGPLLSLVLAGLGWLGLRVLEPGTVAAVLMFELMVTNLAVGVFNLLPGLPLDGGRVLQAGIWKATGRRTTGIRVSGWAGRALAALLLVLPFLVFQRVSPVTILWLALVASFIWLGASQALQVARLRERVPGLTARGLARRAVPVPADLPLSEALRRAVDVGARALVVVDAAGNPTALASEAAVVATPENRRPWVPVASVSRS
ncbi:MAG: site-2 protease family protein, partial [Actinomycetota bacterium]|nr:site-2 protease family protein [Actinomycetota bacterium]